MDAGRTREWSRAAFAMAALFASLPVACRIFLGAWGFQEAVAVAGLCVFGGTYLHIRSRRLAALPDPAAMMDEAIGFATSGKIEEGIEVLTEAVRLSPWLWQGFQYRGALYLCVGQPAQTVEDLTEAIRLAPEEASLYTLRGQAHGLLGDEAAAKLDYEAAAVLGRVGEVGGGPGSVLWFR